MAGRLTEVGQSLRYNGGALAGPPHGGQLLSGIVGIRDMVYGGHYYIAGAGEGIVTIDGNPAQRIVRLVDRGNGYLVRQMMSGKDGTYRFDNLRGDLVWQVIGIDHTDNENAVIADRIAAVPMP